MSEKKSFVELKKILLISLTMTALIWGLGSCSVKNSRPVINGGVWYQVKPGDNLFRISQRFKVDQIRLQRENQIYDPNDLSAGMKIFIPQQIQPVSRSNEYNPVNLESFTKNDRMLWPSKGSISSRFGRRHGRMHQGIDITKTAGEKIRAAKSGTVVYAGWKKGYGKTVIINHGGGLKTLYAHNSRIYVKKGRLVRKGNLISKMGNTGRSTGIHLHFEVIKNGKPIDPINYLPPRNKRGSTEMANR
ncbi:MAG: LysM peptidoglycan-binding domain-containing M23 family metallopeptidase [Deltaproteobacteria bacterium]|nr:LysM peptidoglycan-binding domain-containing M23 family metallopeptidase [Deltaproteobacteria bacterium]